MLPILVYWLCELLQLSVLFDLSRKWWYDPVGLLGEWCAVNVKHLGDAWTAVESQSMSVSLTETVRQKPGCGSGKSHSFWGHIGEPRIQWSFSWAPLPRANIRKQMLSASVPFSHGRTMSYLKFKNIHILYSLLITCGIYPRRILMKWSAFRAHILVNEGCMRKLKVLKNKSQKWYQIHSDQLFFFSF